MHQSNTEKNIYLCYITVFDKYLYGEKTKLCTVFVMLAFIIDIIKKIQKVELIAKKYDFRIIFYI